MHSLKIWTLLRSASDAFSERRPGVPRITRRRWPRTTRCWANALKPVFATTGHQLPFGEPGSSDRRELWIRVEQRIGGCAAPTTPAIAGQSVLATAHSGPRLPSSTVLLCAPRVRDESASAPCATLLARRSLQTPCSVGVGTRDAGIPAIWQHSPTRT
jgi:hypothetical protein